MLMFFKFKSLTCAIAYVATFVNTTQIDETTIATCVMNQTHNDNEHIYDLEFEGYNSQGLGSVGTDKSRLSCAYQQISEDQKA